MKNYKLPLVAFGIVLLVASCKKEDVQQNRLKTTSTNGSKGSWNLLTDWSMQKVDDSTSTSFYRISDTSINAAVVNSGFVLVFKKNGNTIQSLPFSESAETYWYYQVSKGLLRIDRNTNNVTQANLNGQTFAYLIFTPEKISLLKEQGKSTLDLMQLNYEQALELSK